MQPFFSIISVTFKDTWSLTKSMRSVSRQTCKDFEYIVIDGNSQDGTAELIEFWEQKKLVTRHLIEPDTGVYEAMNKGLRLACGQYVCFLNAGDTFASDTTLQEVKDTLLQNGDLDGLLGWGELNGQIWASWVESPAFKLASLGFCHQALYVKLDLLRQFPFDARPFKTDSDTLQLARLYEAGARIKVIRQVMALRGGEPGISANLEKTQTSIIGTMLEEYPSLQTPAAQAILEFRRKCSQPEEVLALLGDAEPNLRQHLAYMVLDTLLLRQSTSLPLDMTRKLFRASQQVLLALAPQMAATALPSLLDVQEGKCTLLGAAAAGRKRLKDETAVFVEQERSRIAKVKSNRKFQPKAANYVVSLTSFPARLSTLHPVIQSLIEQSMPPAAIHLWLGKDEVPRRSYLPGALLEFEKHGLQIHFTDKTCHQYDKFLHNSSLNADRPFVIVDDDVIYPEFSMETLLEMHARHPNAVVANRCHLLVLDDGGIPAPYTKWQQEVRLLNPSLAAFPTGAGGVLYPTGFMQDDFVTDQSLILAYAPYADDIWLKICALARGIPAIATGLSHTSKWYHRYTPTMRAGALHATNVEFGLNDWQMTRALSWLSGKRPKWKQELVRAIKKIEYAN